MIYILCSPILCLNILLNIIDKIDIRCIELCQIYSMTMFAWNLH